MIHLALIGSGRWGKQYIKSIASRNDCELRFVSSPRVTSDTKIPGRYVKVTDYRQLLSNKEIDGVIIATPSNTHFTIASAFVRNGQNVLIEKPMTTNYKDAIKLKRLADRRKAVVMVGHLYHYNSAFQALLGFRSKIGSFRFIQSAAGKPGCLLVHDSTLWEWGPHDIAMCLEVLCAMPTAVSAQAIQIHKKIDSQVRMTLFFQDDIRAFLHFGWYFPYKERLFTMTGSRGHLSFNELDKKVVFTNTSGKKITITHAEREPLQEQLNQFVQSIKSKKKLQTGVDDGIAVVKVLHFAEKSIQNKGKVIRIV